MRAPATNWERITACGLFPAWRGAGKDNGSAPNESQIDVCRAWLRHFAVPTVTMRPRMDSYWLKHVVEDWTRGQNLDYVYIANGAFIEAARREGYRLRRAGDGVPSAIFNMRRVVPAVPQLFRNSGSIPSGPPSTALSGDRPSPPAPPRAGDEVNVVHCSGEAGEDK